MRLGTQWPRDHSLRDRGRRTSVLIVPFGYPYYPYYPYGLSYDSYGLARPGHFTSPYYPRSVLRVPGQAESQIVAADSNLVVEQIGTAVLRLTWPGAGPAAATAREVRFFLADSDEQVLALQAVHAAPFTALFDANARVAYVGVTVIYADGRRSTTALPFQLAR